MSNHQFHINCTEPAVKIRSRVYHEKSRHGCVGCKAKRVKCDESKPFCLRCIKYNRECHYKESKSQPSFAKSQSRAQSPVPNRCAVPSSSANSRAIKISTSTPLAASDSPPFRSSSERPFSTWDLELVFHYTTSTCHTLATSDLDQELWQLALPKAASSKAFLMYGLLAISSLHIAHLRPSDAKSYRNIGMKHYSSALGLWKSQLQDLSISNADAVATFVVLIEIISFAMLEEPPLAGPDYLEAVLSTFCSLRSVRDTLQSAWPMLEMTPTGLLLFLDTGKTGEITAVDMDVALEGLKWHIYAAEVQSEHLRTEYLDAVRYLGLSWQLKMQILSWPLLVSHDFFREMTRKEPVAIAILGFYGMLLNMLKDAWWVGDKGHRLVSAASETLPPEYKTWMRWEKEGTLTHDDEGLG